MEGFPSAFGLRFLAEVAVPCSELLVIQVWDAVTNSACARSGKGKVRTKGRKGKPSGTDQFLRWSDERHSPSILGQSELQ